MESRFAALKASEIGASLSSVSDGGPGERDDARSAADGGHIVNKSEAPELEVIDEMEARESSRKRDMAFSGSPLDAPGEQSRNGLHLRERSFNEIAGDAPGASGASENSGTGSPSRRARHLPSLGSGDGSEERLDYSHMTQKKLISQESEDVLQEGEGPAGNSVEDEGQLGFLR